MSQVRCSDNLEVTAQTVSGVAVLMVLSSEADFPPLVTITTIIRCPKKLVNCKTNKCKNRQQRSSITFKKSVGILVFFLPPQ